MDIEKLKFPIGKYEAPNPITSDVLEKYIQDIASFPERLKKETTHLDSSQLDTPYRPGGWTVRQVIHHCADSHMNSFIRFKLALTEDKPTIKPYYEDRWAESVDYTTMSIEPSIQLLEGLHARWIVLLKSLTTEDLSRTFIHPEHGKEIRLDENIGTYAWHGNHHLAHIMVLKSIKGWE